MRPSSTHFQATWPALALVLLLPSVAAAQAGPGRPSATLAEQRLPELATLERLVRQGDSARALPQIDVALKARPDDAALAFLRSVALENLGRPAEARSALEALTQRHPELPEPYNNLAVLRAAAGELDAARGLLDEALRIQPGYRVAQENLGDVLAAMAARAYAAAAAGVRPEPALQRKLAAAQALAAGR